MRQPCSIFLSILDIKEADSERLRLRPQEREALEGDGRHGDSSREQQPQCVQAINSLPYCLLFPAADPPGHAEKELGELKKTRETEKGAFSAKLDSIRALPTLRRSSSLR